jgi:hypothetical protein
MNSVPTSSCSSHLRTSDTVNSGPLSDRIYEGRPRSTNSRPRTRSTSLPVSFRPTSIARHSRLYSVQHRRERRQRLDLPAIDSEMLARLVDNFEDVMAEGTNPQKKDLLRRLVKKVLVHDKRTIEIWYALPNQASVRTLGHVAPRVGVPERAPVGFCGAGDCRRSEGTHGLSTSRQDVAAPI